MPEEGVFKKSSEEQKTMHQFFSNLKVFTLGFPSDWPIFLGDGGEGSKSGETKKEKRDFWPGSSAGCGLGCPMRVHSRSICATVSSPRLGDTENIKTNKLRL